MHESSKCKLLTGGERKSCSDFSEKNDSDSPKQQRSEQIKNSFWLPLEKYLLIFVPVQCCFKPTRRLMADHWEDIIVLFPLKMLPPLFQGCRAKWEMGWQWKSDPHSLSRGQPWAWAWRWTLYYSEDEMEHCFCRVCSNAVFKSTRIKTEHLPTPHD